MTRKTTATAKRTCFLQVFAACLSLITVACSTIAGRHVPPAAPPQQPPPARAESLLRIPTSVVVPDFKPVADQLCNLYKGREKFTVSGFSGEADYEVWQQSQPAIALSGNTVTATLPLYYWVSGHVAGISGQCGWNDEMPRELVIGATSTFGWDSDWAIRTTSKITRLDAPNRCHVTGANKDITPFITGVSERLLNRALTKLDEDIRKRSSFRRHAESAWTSLNSPQRVADGVWLTVAPSAVLVTPLTVSGTPMALKSTVIVSVTPTVRTDEAQLAPVPPLPPLTEGQNEGDESFSFDLDFDASFVALLRALKEGENAIVGKEFGSGGRSVFVRDASIYTAGQMLVLKLDVGSEMAPAKPSSWQRLVRAFRNRLSVVEGSLYFVGTPFWDEPTRTLAVPDLDFHIDTENVLAKSAGWLLQSQIREDLRRASRVQLGGRIDDLRDGVRSALNRQLTPNIKLSGAVEQMRVKTVFLKDDAVSARVVVSGRVEIAGSLTPSQ